MPPALSDSTRTTSEPCGKPADQKALINTGVALSVSSSPEAGN